MNKSPRRRVNVPLEAFAYGVSMLILWPFVGIDIALGAVILSATVQAMFAILFRRS